MPNHYAVLNVPYFVDDAGIKEAHKKKIKTVHPDARGLNEIAVDTNNARDVLLDHDRRLGHDLSLLHEAYPFNPLTSSAVALKMWGFDLPLPELWAASARAALTTRDMFFGDRQPLLAAPTQRPRALLAYESMR